jgi:hypothetical protein
MLGAAMLGIQAAGQGGPALEKTQSAPNEPEYEDTFSGAIVQLSAVAVTASRSILGKPAEKRTFFIKSETRIEGGKLRMNAKVTIGFISTDDGDVARLIVVRATQRSPQNKK